MQENQRGPSLRALTATSALMRLISARDSAGKRASSVRDTPHCGQLQSDQTAVAILLVSSSSSGTTGFRDSRVTVTCFATQSVHVRGSWLHCSNLGKFDPLRPSGLLVAHILHSRYAASRPRRRVLEESFNWDTLVFSCFSSTREDLADGRVGRLRGLL